MTSARVLPHSQQTVGLFWDINSLPIPSTVDPMGFLNLISNLGSSFSANNMLTTSKVFGNKSILPRYTLDLLSIAQFEIEDISEEIKDITASMASDILSWWSHCKNLDPISIPCIILIASDQRLTHLLNILPTRFQINSVLISEKYGDDVHIDWHTLVTQANMTSDALINESQDHSSQFYHLSSTSSSPPTRRSSFLESFEVQSLSFDGLGSKSSEMSNFNADNVRRSSSTCSTRRSSVSTVDYSQGNTFNDEVSHFNVIDALMWDDQEMEEVIDFSPVSCGNDYTQGRNSLLPFPTEEDSNGFFANYGVTATSKAMHNSNQLLDHHENFPKTMNSTEFTDRHINPMGGKGSAQMGYGTGCDMLSFLHTGVSGDTSTSFDDDSGLLSEDIQRSGLFQMTMPYEVDNNGNAMRNKPDFSADNIPLSSANDVLESITHEQAGLFQALSMAFTTRNIKAAVSTLRQVYTKQCRRFRIPNLLSIIIPETVYPFPNNDVKAGLSGIVFTLNCIQWSFTGKRIDSVDSFKYKMNKNIARWLLKEQQRKYIPPQLTQDVVNLCISVSQFVYQSTAELDFGMEILLSHNIANPKVILSSASNQIESHGVSFSLMGSNGIPLQAANRLHTPTVQESLQVEERLIHILERAPVEGVLGAHMPAIYKEMYGEQLHLHGRKLKDVLVGTYVVEMLGGENSPGGKRFRLIGGFIPSDLPELSSCGVVHKSLNDVNSSSIRSNTAYNMLHQHSQRYQQQPYSTNNNVPQQRQPGRVMYGNFVEEDRMNNIPYQQPQHAYKNYTPANPEGNSTSHRFKVQTQVIKMATARVLLQRECSGCWDADADNPLVLRLTLRGGSICRHRVLVLNVLSWDCLLEIHARGFRRSISSMGMRRAGDEQLF
eukprot:gene6891-13969_t